MVKKCIYCGCEINDESVIDFCKKCGVGVWGEKMFNAIVSNMENAQKRGDLDQGSVFNSREILDTVRDEKKDFPPSNFN